MAFFLLTMKFTSFRQRNAFESIANVEESFTVLVQPVAKMTTFLWLLKLL